MGSIKQETDLKEKANSIVELFKNKYASLLPLGTQEKIEKVFPSIIHSVLEEVEFQLTIRDEKKRKEVMRILEEEMIGFLADFTVNLKVDTNLQGEEREVANLVRSGFMELITEEFLESLCMKSKKELEKKEVSFVKYLQNECNVDIKHQGFYMDFYQFSLNVYEQVGEDVVTLFNEFQKEDTQVCLGSKGK